MSQPTDTTTITATVSDRDVVDAIATYLGTASEWSGADALEVIADLIGRVRPHPGDAEGTYVADFLAATGRPVMEAWRMDDPDEEDDEQA